MKIKIFNMKFGETLHFSTYDSRQEVYNMSEDSLVFARDKNSIRSLEISNFSRFIGVDWSLIHEAVLTIKSTEDLKSAGSSYYYLGQSRSEEARKRNLRK